MAKKKTDLEHVQRETEGLLLSSVIKIMSDKEALEYDAKMIKSDWKKVVRW